VKRPSTDSARRDYHAALPDQRWAYDLLVAPNLLGSSRLQDYGCYGVPVLAPTGGLVTLAHDGEPDEVPGTESNNSTAPFGNHVAIQLGGTGTYLVIAHLKPGSVAVEEGQTVEEGQLIGECGSSGRTSEPHIHIHHQRQDPTVFPINFAEGLPLAARSYLSSESAVLDDGATVRVARLLLWYLGDFGGKAGILRLLRRFEVIEPLAAPRVAFGAYDWTLAVGPSSSGLTLSMRPRGVNGLQSLDGPGHESRTVADEPLARA
jgi:hypothetical protein